MASRPAPLGEFEVLVILAVLQLGSGATGTSVRAEIEHRAGRKVARGAVYVTLDRLDEKKLLASKYSDATPERGGHPGRVFRVTPAGVGALRESVAARQKMQKGLEAVLRGAE
jgi:DNA-binding PadR family transcriptional regulator